MIELHPESHSSLWNYKAAIVSHENILLKYWWGILKPKCFLSEDFWIISEKSCLIFDCTMMLLCERSTWEHWHLFMFYLPNPRVICRESFWKKEKPKHDISWQCQLCRKRRQIKQIWPFMLSQAITYLNRSKTNENPPFYHVQKCLSLDCFKGEPSNLICVQSWEFGPTEENGELRSWLWS